MANQIQIDEKTTRGILAQYDLGGRVAGVSPCGEGHINDTFQVHMETGKRYILQRINTEVFRSPDRLMENICGVTDYLRVAVVKNGGNPDREAMRVRKTRDGRSWIWGAGGGAFRVYDFVEDTLCLQRARGAEDLRMAGEAFGGFQRLLSGYPAHTLHETIPGFHDTPARYGKLMKAAAADALGRVDMCGAEIAFAAAREADCHVLTELLAAGELPLRVTHNDTKLNNVLIDKATGKGVCIIDLDTVMPGLSPYDFGDTVRSGANDCEEDEPDLSRVNFSLTLYESLTEGFLTGCGDGLTENEKRYLPWGARIMTLECGIRFLTDYLEGDHYFKISRPGQNLDRARTQFQLVRDMERSWGEMNDIIRKYCPDVSKTSGDIC